MTRKLLVTSYTNPDLDGTACAYAYAELLRAQGEDAVAAVFGVPQREAQFVLRTGNIPALQNADAILSEYKDVILVDVSNTTGISTNIHPSQVVEIIDHRKVHQADKFPNAKVQIELVGSAATLIAEKYLHHHIPISEKSAVLLYSAIISNTINFQANITTDRDRQMADWLLTKVHLPQDYIHRMFADKSILDGPFREVFDFAHFTFRDKQLDILQLEILDAEGYIQKNIEEITQVISEIKGEKELDYIFLSAIDLEKATNTFVAIDEPSQKLVETALGVQFQNNIAHKNGIMMGKTIMPLVKETIENGQPL